MKKVYILLALSFCFAVFGGISLLGSKRVKGEILQPTNTPTFVFATATRGSTETKVAEEPTEAAEEPTEAAEEPTATKEEPTAAPSATPTPAEKVAEATATVPVEKTAEAVVETTEVAEDSCVCQQATPTAVPEKTEVVEETTEVIQVTEEVIPNVATTETVATEEPAEEKAFFAVGVKYTALVQMPILSANGTLYAYSPDVPVPTTGIKRSYTTDMPQFALNGQIVGGPTAGFVEESYEFFEITYEYLVETDVEITSLINSVTLHIRDDKRGKFFSARAEMPSAELKEIVKVWLSKVESQYWTICQKPDGTYILILGTQAYTPAQKTAYRIATAPTEVPSSGGGGDGGGEKPKDPDPEVTPDPHLPQPIRTEPETPAQPTEPAQPEQPVQPNPRLPQPIRTE